MGLVFVEPSVSLLKSFRDALPKYHAEGSRLTLRPCEIGDDLFAFWNRFEILLPPQLKSAGYDYRWAVLDGVYVGELTCLRELNVWAYEHAGQIGVEVRPDYRRKGLGVALIKEGLRLASCCGHPLALISCAEGNVASRGMIEKAGAFWDSTIVRPKGNLRRYWCPTSKGRG